MRDLQCLAIQRPRPRALHPPSETPLLERRVAGESRQHDDGDRRRLRRRHQAAVARDCSVMKIRGPSDDAHINRHQSSNRRCAQRVKRERHQVRALAPDHARDHSIIGTIAVHRAPRAKDRHEFPAQWDAPRDENTATPSSIGRGGLARGYPPPNVYENGRGSASDVRHRGPASRALG